MIGSLRQSVMTPTKLCLLEQQLRYQRDELGLTGVDLSRLTMDQVEVYG